MQLDLRHLTTEAGSHLAAKARRKTMQIQKEREEMSQMTQTEEWRDDVSGAVRCENYFLYVGEHN